MDLHLNCVTGEIRAQIYQSIHHVNSSEITTLPTVRVRYSMKHVTSLYICTKTEQRHSINIMDQPRIKMPNLSKHCILQVGVCPVRLLCR